MKTIITFQFLLLFIGSLCSQPIVQFDKTYGGTGCENGKSARQTPDGGFVMIGSTNSYGAGQNDIYLIKTDQNGNEIWSKTYGDSGNEALGWAMTHTIVLSKDGGFAFAGRTNSYGAGDYDVWLVKTDENGITEWSQTFGSSSYDGANILKQTKDGGYIITGSTWGFGAYANDVYLVRTDSNGVLKWENHYPVLVYEEGSSVIETSDGGFLVTGVSYSPQTAFLLKVDSNGNQEWLNMFISGWGFSIEPTSDEGYIICGVTGDDSFLAKTDSEGTILWTKVILGPGANFAYAIQQLDDGGYIAAGETNGFGNNWDFYIFRTDPYGDTLWTKVFEDAGNDWATSVQVTQDGSYLVAGFTTSYGAGCSDYRMMKLKEVISPGFITGKIYKDDNDNCIYETEIDAPLNRQIVVAEPGPYYGFTDSDGNFKLEVEPGNYTLNQTTTDNDLYGLQDCQTDSTYNLSVSQGETVTQIDFALKQIKGVCEGEVSIVSSPFLPGPCAPLSLSSPCPGFLHRYCFTITNTGTNPIGPGSTVEIALDPNMTFEEEVSISCTGDGGLVIEDPTIPTWNVTDAIVASGSCTVCFNVNVNGIPIAPAPYSTTSNFNAICGNNTHTSSDLVEDYDVCGCDPNDKMVSPKGCGLYHNIAMNESITYRIRFQNVGTGPAHNITIIDTLDPNFDLSTFNLLMSSHNITSLQLNPGNILEVTYTGIELPDSASNPAGSQGEFFFEITPLPNLPEGTVISNNAAIYFDNNPPVITNTVFNTLREISAPIADFTYQRDCESIDNVYTFTYTGGTSDNATFFWDFGDANPAFSTSENPGNVIFNNTGVNEVILTIERYGCTDSYSLAIDAPVVTCGNGKKILICHIPPGNPENPQTICISPNALPAHLAHGDCVGACNILSNNKMANSSDKDNNEENIVSLEDDLFVIYPNPINNENAVIEFKTEESEFVIINIYNSFGQEVSQIFNSKVESNHLYKIKLPTNEFSSGVYLVKFLLDNESKLLKFVIVR